MAGALSIALWMSVIACGRMLAFVDSAEVQTFPSALKILSGVNGMSVSGSAPSGRSASLTAFMIEPGAPAVPASPAPLAPSSLSAVGETTWPHRCPASQPPSARGNRPYFR